MEALSYFSNILEGHKLTQIQHCINGEESEFGEGGKMIANSTYYGPAYMISKIDNESMGQTMSSIQLVSHVPIDNDSFLLRHGVMVKKVPTLNDKENEAIIDKIKKSKNFNKVFNEIFENMSFNRIDNGYDEWYKNDIEDVSK